MLYCMLSRILLNHMTAYAPPHAHSRTLMLSCLCVCSRACFRFWYASDVNAYDDINKVARVMLVLELTVCVRLLSKVLIAVYVHCFCHYFSTGTGSTRLLSSRFGYSTGSMLTGSPLRVMRTTHKTAFIRFVHSTRLFLVCLFRAHCWPGGFRWLSCHDALHVAALAGSNEDPS